MAEKHKVGAFELLGGVLAVTPRAHIALPGLLRMALTKPGQKKSIGQLLEKWARKRPEQIALMDVNQRYSYRAVNSKANRIAGLLRRCGIRRGNSVGLLLENRADLLIAAGGCLKLGAAACMLNHHQRGEVLLHSIGLSRPGVLIVGSECREAFESIRHQLPRELVGKVFWIADPATPATIDGLRDLERELAAEQDLDPAETASVTTSDAAFHVFTSGTTGMPKAAVMSHGRWLKAMHGVGTASLRMRGDDVFYCALPLYHNNALTLSWGAALAGGCALAISRKFSASRFWDEVQRFEATAFCYIGELCRYLLAQPQTIREQNHKVRVMLGNGLRPELWEPFRSRFGVAHINEFYGASECNLLFTNAFNVDRSCGFTPLSYRVVAYDPETEQPLRDAKGRLQRVGRGEVGLLLTEVTQRAPFDGYTSREEGEKKLHRDAFKAGDLWFNTGDLVRDMGLWHVQFVDRLGDTFRWRGENVATTEVEKVLNGFPQVAEAVVYGVQVPGEEGRAGMAALTLNPGEQLDSAGLARYLTSNLPAYAVPQFLRLRSDHETTSTFKHQKAALKRAGFDPAGSQDPLLAFDEASGDYLPLTAERHAAIRAAADVGPAAQAAPRRRPQPALQQQRAT